MIELLVHLILLASAGSLLISLLLRRGAKKNPNPAEQVVELTDAVRHAEIINGSFFRSLELVEKNLESLLARANKVEENLRALLPKAERVRTDPYSKASSLLAEGKDAKEISQSLNLPVSQVRLIKELQERLEIKDGAMEKQAREKERIFEEGIGAWKDLGGRASPGNHPALRLEKVAASGNGIP